MSVSPPDAGPEPACDVYYLRIEPSVGGFRWVIAKFGAVEPALAGPILPTEHAARAAGRAGLDRLLAQENSWSARHPGVLSVGQISADR